MEITIDILRKLIGKKIVWKEQSEVYHGKLLEVSKSDMFCSLMVYDAEKERIIVVYTSFILGKILEILDVFDYEVITTPLRNGTGPLGKGKKTGRKLGPCK